LGTENVFFFEVVGNGGGERKGSESKEGGGGVGRTQGETPVPCGGVYCGIVM